MKALLLLVAAFLLLGTAAATTFPTLNIAQTTASYGQIDKINATAQSVLDFVEIQINNSVVAGPKNNTVNYTVCSTAACLLPGTYSVFSKDTSNGRVSASKYLVITSVKPRLQVQNAQSKYGSPNQLSVSPPSANDSVSILLNNNTFYTATGSYTYTACNYAENMPCLPAGKFNVTVYDSTEKVYSPIQVVTVSPIAPQLFISSTSIAYGKTNKITAIAPVSNDTISIHIGSSTVASGTGEVSYTVCSNSSSPCLAVGNYNVSSYDKQENLSSDNQSLHILPSYPSFTVSAAEAGYGSEVVITTVAPSKNDSLTLYANRSSIASGSYSINYHICDMLNQTMCLVPGVYNISVYDSPEDIYTKNTVLTILPTAPSLVLSASGAPQGGIVYINATAPYYTDKISIQKDNVSLANGTGFVSYAMCIGSSTCPGPGTYKITVYDSTEKAYSEPQELQIAGSKGSSNQSSSSTLNTTVPTTTVSGGKSSGGVVSSTKPSNLLLYGVLALVIVIAIVAFLLIRRRQSSV